MDTVRLPGQPDAIAPDGSEVRVLVRGERGSMAHFQLAAGQTSIAVQHRSVEEVWYFVGGRGEMWRRRGQEESVVEVAPGVSIRIAPGTAFQFRSFDPEPLAAVGVTMPSWPLDRDDEAVPVAGPWAPTVSGPG
jgi:mannose-6-phosphate isomerase-like protein (cupin superfamily)